MEHLQWLLVKNVMYTPFVMKNGELFFSEKKIKKSSNNNQIYFFF